MPAGYQSRITTACNSCRQRKQKVRTSLARSRANPVVQRKPTQMHPMSQAPAQLQLARAIKTRTRKGLHRSP
ncbi:uncharacterized protein BDW70DRAFT_126647 [Aspergillus foveolatus]|uniref:uncharacterized protein n=1 Tax=Aspergillus foveolatus TaxID=210207 RepID=UPI003CCE1EF7